MHSHLGQLQGREFWSDWLTLNQFDPDQPSWVRGWLANEQRAMEFGNIGAPRTPPGMVMGHGLDTRAADGFDYSNAKLTGADINKLEEQMRAALRACP
jgi:hypothetical protein